MTKKFKAPELPKTRFKAELPDQTQDEKKPIFALFHLQKKYDLDPCQKNEIAAFAKKLCHLSQMDWGQLRAAGRQGCGSETISRTSIKVGIPSHVTDEVTFLSISFDGKKKMIGYRVDDVFFILWLDRKFEVYDHG